MSDEAYAIPEGLYAIPPNLLDLRSDSEVDYDLLHPVPISGEKNVWFFWQSGYESMRAYAKRNVRAYHRRLSRNGWTVRTLNRVPGSSLNIDRFLDVLDTQLFPSAFADGTIDGDYPAQHTSDLVRIPLLLQYGGVYADVGLLQFGDLDRLWAETVGNPRSSFELLSYHDGGVYGRTLTNYFLGSRPNNPFLVRCHKLLLHLWAADGGRTNTEGMHCSPLLAGVPLMEGSYTIKDEKTGEIIGPEEVRKLLTDYIIQGQVMSAVMGLVDEEDGWNGPQYMADHLYGIEFMVGSQLINEFTEWNGRRAFELMSLSLPNQDEAENSEQRFAREIVETCLKKSFGFKLAHGLILRVFKDTLGSLWRDHEGSDNAPRTYAHWLRYATVHWNQAKLPAPVKLRVGEPSKIGPLLRQ